MKGIYISRKYRALRDNEIYIEMTETLILKN